MGDSIAEKYSEIKAQTFKLGKKHKPIDSNVEETPEGKTPNHSTRDIIFKLLKTKDKKILDFVLNSKTMIPL